VQEPYRDELTGDVEPSLPNRRSIGTKATWIGTTSRATTTTNRKSLPRKSMKVKRVAANAANMIGSTVAGNRHGQ
jgi:hypothetical protein